MRILVAMSGGVDSSVVAHLLKKEGHDIVGVMMRLWVDPLAPLVRKALPTKCCSLEHIERARSVCAKLRVPFYVHNLEKEFKEQVVDPFLKAYEEGKTPNPCIFCNRTIKFGSLLELCKTLGCEKIATGHYARIRERKHPGGKTEYQLLEALDKEKDQSYYLYGLTEEQRSHVLFPLGEKYKDDVFALAKKFGVPLQESYRESQDLCFFPEKGPQAFLKRYLNLVPGRIKTLAGKDVGAHDGLPLYTIGQRRGLGIGGLKIPLQVISKDAKTNTLYVATKEEGLATVIRGKTLDWLGAKPLQPLEARIRSLGPRYKGTVHETSKGWEFTSETSIGSITPGQAMVLYDGEMLVGGGMIEG